MYTNPWMMEKEMARRRSEILRIAEQEQLGRSRHPVRGSKIGSIFRLLFRKFSGPSREMHSDPRDMRVSTNWQPNP